MTTTDRQQRAVEGTVSALTGHTAGVTGTSVPRHSDPMHDHWDEAWRLGYATALRDAVETVKAVYTPQEGTYIGLCIHADAVAAIEALGGEQ